MDTKHIHHIHLLSPFPDAHSLPLVPTIGKDLVFLGTRDDPGLGIMEFAQPLHVEVCRASSTIISPSTWCLDLCSHISLKDKPAVSAYQPPDPKLDKVAELLGDSLMPD
jgi:hypothetical protein